MSTKRLLERFLRYVKIDTTSQDNPKSYPSSVGQIELGTLLANELRQIRLEEVAQDKYSIVRAALPAAKNIAQKNEEVPTIAFCAHLDTSPETDGHNVKPHVVKNYDGADLVLPGNASRVIRKVDNPELKSLIGKTIITSDGTTLLGADDKDGLAVIIEAITRMVEDPEAKHGPIRLCFTCDEEIGHGTDHIDVQNLGATVCYTLDGQGADQIDVETFSANLAIVTIKGVNIHPSIAKRRMTNAVRVASSFLQRIQLGKKSAETTEKREPFVHPYEISGSVAQTTLKILLRAFEANQLLKFAEDIQRAADATVIEFPNAEIDISITKQYRNMAEGLRREPRAIKYAQQALRRLGRNPKLTIVRGGTDGSRLTELGLPTPNLSCGQHSPHSPLEWACLEEMEQAVEWLIELAAVWSEVEN